MLNSSVNNTQTAINDAQTAVENAQADVDDSPQGPVTAAQIPVATAQTALSNAANYAAPFSGVGISDIVNGVNMATCLYDFLLVFFIILG